MSREQQKEIELIADYKKTPLWNDSLPLSDRLDYLINELTLEEKLQCLTTRGPEIERLGMRSFFIGGEAAHGIEARHDQDFNEGTQVKTTVFTQPIGLSATWDTELMEKVGIVTGTEARAAYLINSNIGLSRWGPTVDMERDPRWGRTEEGYGEDPYLTGKMSSAYVMGMQGSDSFYLRCGATLKHFYANNQEKDREKSSSSLDVRNKQEYYLEPFRRAITEGRAEAVMTSYNEINGIPAIVNPEIRELVKNSWGLKGHVVCDMADLAQTVTEHKYCKTNAEALALGLEAGIDSFNDPEEVVIAAARDALQNGLITIEDINCAIRNTFATKLRLGLYDASDRCPYSAITTEVLNCKEHKDICLEAAKKAVVLLKNDKQLLPLTGDTTERIAVVGPLADTWDMDWYSGIPASKITPWKGIKKSFPHATLSLSDGIDRVKLRVGSNYIAVREDGSTYLSNDKGAEIFEHTDWGDNKHTLRACSSMKYLSADSDTGFITASKTEVFSWCVNEVFSIWYAKSEIDTKENGFIMKSWKQTPVYIGNDGALLYNLSMQGEKNSLLFSKDVPSEGTLFYLELVDEGIVRAVECARGADKVIAFVGCHPIISCKESTDRENLELPLSQRKLLQQLYQVNPNIILVLITNYPYYLEWEKEHLPAILMTASGGQELGTAIAEVIAGAVSPAGRLNMTWYPKDVPLPSLREYDIIHAKRTYQYYSGEVLYPFGYGLSYTDFDYHSLRVTREQEQLRITLFVKNVGFYDSDEVVQLYVSQLHSRATRPIRQLKGFQRIFIKQGEDKKVEFELPYRELEYYDVVTGRMLLEDSVYSIQMGASSQDIHLENSIYVSGTVIPNRDMTKAIICDHYDSYENLSLHIGYNGKPCILPETGDVQSGMPVKGSAFFKNAVFDYCPEEFVIDMKSEEEGSITVWLGYMELVRVNCSAMEEFQVVRAPVKSKNIESGIKYQIRIDIVGRQRIVEFYFC